MTGSLSDEVGSVIVARLRSAGCVFAEDEARLLMFSASTRSELGAMVDRRVAGEPLEHILGWVEFCGLRIALDPGVFVPGQRSEFLVRQATALARQATGRSAPVDRSPRPKAPRTAARPVVVVDLCCGSGALGAALAAGVDGVELYAVDIDPAAVTCARHNLAASGGQVFEGDLYEPLPEPLAGRVDILIANVPYVPSDEIRLLPAEARDHEARVALDGGADGLEVARRVSAAALGWLAPGAHLLIETSQGQAQPAADIFARDGLTPRIARSDECDAAVVIGTTLSTRP